MGLAEADPSGEPKIAPGVVAGADDGVPDEPGGHFADMPPVDHGHPDDGVTARFEDACARWHSGPMGANVNARAVAMFGFTAVAFRAAEDEDLAQAGAQNGVAEERRARSAGVSRVALQGRIPLVHVKNGERDSVLSARIKQVNAMGIRIAQENDPRSGEYPKSLPGVRVTTTKMDGGTREPLHLLCIASPRLSRLPKPCGAL